MDTSKIIKGAVSSGRYTVTAPDSADMVADANITSGQAVDTTHLTDSVTMLTKEGFELRHEVFLHKAPTPEPGEVEE